MTIATYSELKTAVADELNRSDLSAKAADWVLMGESRLNRDLRMLDMVATDAGTLSTSDRTLALPDRFLEKIQFRLTDPLTELFWVPPARLMEYSSEESETGQPRRYTVTSQIEFDRVPDAAYGYVFKFYQGYRLTEAEDTNYLLTTYPQAYLFAACMYGALYVKDVAMAQQYAALAKSEVRAIKQAEAQRKGTSEALLVNELSMRPDYNINQG